MSTVTYLIILAIMPIATFLLSHEKETQSSDRLLQAEEIDDLNKFRLFLYGVQGSIRELRAKLETVNYNNLQYETLFSPFEINTLKSEISHTIEELDTMVLEEAISPEDFYSQVDSIRKRIDVLTTPLAAHFNTSFGYYNAGYVA